MEIIRQLVARDKSVLVCGASNLAVDNLLERLVPHRIPLTRIGHPARVMEALHAATLDAQTARSEQFALASDVKKDIENAMGALTGKGKGKLKGSERRKMWDEVKELRKEYRKREGTVVSSVVKQAKVCLCDAMCVAFAHCVICRSCSLHATALGDGNCTIARSTSSSSTRRRRL